MNVPTRLMSPLIVFAICVVPTAAGTVVADADSISLAVVYNDVAQSDAFVSDQGFSCLVQIGNRSCLFDGGRIAEHLAHNVERMQIDCSLIESIIISHLHSDHIGGLPGIIENCERPKLYLPVTYPRSQTDRGRRYVADRLEFVKQHSALAVSLDHPGTLGGCVYTTGPMEERTYEQAMVIDTTVGLVVLVGCSHPGIVQIVNASRSLLNKDVHFVMGGFHLAVTDSNQVANIARELRNSTRFIAPCHCTGENAQKVFRKIFKEDYIEVGAGQVLRLP